MDCPACECGDEGAIGGLPIWVSLILSTGLVILSGLFSGLTLGLLSLDKMGLDILKDSGEPRERVWASIIIPVRRNGNLLLCTLLLGNTLVNSFLAILLAGISSGIVGLITATTLIVIFGEIVPQSVCSRLGLMIGANTIWITRFFLVVLYPVAKPVSMVLDWVLGDELGTVYSRDELKKLIAIHSLDPEAQKESGLTKDDHGMLVGALEYKDKAVTDVMTQLDNVFMLDAGVRLSFENMLDIYKSGYTRIPVYENSRDNIIGVLYTKDLILVDPDDEVEVRAILAFHGGKNTRYILDSTALNDVFRMFKSSYSHLMIAVSMHNKDEETVVSRGQHMEHSQKLLRVCHKRVTGVITLEDVLEEVIKAEIVDEHDKFVDNSFKTRVGGARERVDVAAFLSLFAHKIRQNNKLSRPEVQAVTAFLIATVDEFKRFAGPSDRVLRQIIRRCDVLETADGAGEGGGVDTGVPGLKTNQLQLYTKGEPAGYMVLILQGNVLIKAGEEGFNSEHGPWSHLGVSSLTTPGYRPDYSAVSEGHCRLLRLSRELYDQAVRAAQAGGLVAPRRLLSTIRSDAEERLATLTESDSNGPEEEYGGEAVPLNDLSVRLLKPIDQGGFAPGSTSKSGGESGGAPPRRASNESQEGGGRSHPQTPTDGGTPKAFRVSSKEGVGASNDIISSSQSIGYSHSITGGPRDNQPEAARERHQQAPHTGSIEPMSSSEDEDGMPPPSSQNSTPFKGLSSLFHRRSTSSAKDVSETGACSRRLQPIPRSSDSSGGTVNSKGDPSVAEIV